jgi:maltose alpha-D-glucosyltransferase/alpha-amylase
VRPSDAEQLQPFARLWSAWMGAAFVNSYLQHASHGTLVPERDDHSSALLDFYLLDKCLYELDYEFNNRLEQNQLASEEVPSEVTHKAVGFDERARSAP